MNVVRMCAVVVVCSAHVLDLVGFLCYVLYFLTYLLSHLIPYHKWGAEVSNYHCRITYFSLQCCPFFASHTLMVTRCLNVSNCYIRLLY